MRGAPLLAIAITACLPLLAAERALPAARHAAKSSGWWDPSAAPGYQPEPAPKQAPATPRAGKPPNIVKGPAIEPLRWPDREQTPRKKAPWIIAVGDK